MGAADGLLIAAGPPATADGLRTALGHFSASDDAAACLRDLVRQGLDQLPLPGSGHTLARWRALAAVAEHDLSLAKLYEGAHRRAGDFGRVGWRIATPVARR